MGAYIDMDYVKSVGSMPPPDIDTVESIFPGTFVALELATRRMIDARLTKRYLTPFDFNGASVPEVVRWNQAQLVVAALFQKRGYNPGSAQDQIIQQNKVDALAWLKEAADSEAGLVELPLKEGTSPDSPGIVKASPLSTSDQTPYDWIDRQAWDVDKIG